jgi:hypothetical protein
LDAIDAADATFTHTTAIAPMSAEYPVKAQMELNTLLDSIRAQITQGTTAGVRFFIDDFSKLARALARFSVVADREQLEDALRIVDSVAEESMARSAAEEFIPARDVADVDIRFIYREIVLPRIMALRRYFAGMYEGVDRSPVERKALSSNLLKSSGLTRLYTPGQETLDALRGAVPAGRARALARERQRMEGEFGRARIRPEFARVARPREEDEADEVGAGGRRRFDRDQRQVFGDRAGAFFGEAAPADEWEAEGRGRGRGRASNPMRHDRSNRMSGAVAMREAPVPVFGSRGR